MNIRTTCLWCTVAFTANNCYGCLRLLGIAESKAIVDSVPVHTS
jgi:hypothetical protein